MPASLSQKLRIKEDFILYAKNVPSDFKKKLEMPSIRLIKEGKEYNQIHWFVTNQDQVIKEADNMISLLKENIICWIYFPKGSSGIQTDLTRDKGWDPIIKNEGIQWLNLISFDDTWSAFAFRLTNKTKPKNAGNKPRLVSEYVDSKTKTVRLPKDLDVELAKNKIAMEYFNQLAFSHKKEYVEWIVSAKKEETRKRRIEEAITRLNKKWKNPSNS